VIRKIYLIRHAAVIKPNEKSFFGSTELMLSSVGISQAKRLSDFFSEIPLKSVYCSSLKRAMDTAEIIADKCYKSYGIVKEFDEISLGEWEGKSFSEIKEKYPLEFAKRGLDIYNYKTPGGESFHEVQNRAYSAFESIINNTNGDILIVSHSGVNKVILSKILRVDLQKCFGMEQKYACINIINIHGDSYNVSNRNINIQV